jgi:hypothetical protein
MSYGGDIVPADARPQVRDDRRPSAPLRRVAHEVQFTLDVADTTDDIVRSIAQHSSPVAAAPWQAGERRYPTAQSNHR